MNRINKLFQKKPTGILSVYFTAGYPGMNDTITIIKELAANGADLIEIGMPFSDPMADGPTIQKSNDLALKNGMSLKLLFGQLSEIRSITDIPLILMGYLNPVIQYGMENFCKKCSETGIDGIILPDLPLDVYTEKYREVFEKNGLHNIFLITPQTSEERIRMIDDMSSGFIYMVSSSSTTGIREGFGNEQTEYFRRIKNMQLKNPRLVGFGISDARTFNQACEYANGAIIGSAFIKALSNSKNLHSAIQDFIKRILQ